MVERVSWSCEAMVEVEAMRVRYRRGLEGEVVEAEGGLLGRVGRDLSALDHGG